MGKKIIIELNETFEVDVTDEIKTMEEYGLDTTNAEEVFYELDLEEQVLDELNLRFSAYFSFKED